MSDDHIVRVPSDPPSPEYGPLASGGSPVSSSIQAHQYPFGVGGSQLHLYPSASSSQLDAQPSKDKDDSSIVVSQEAILARLFRVIVLPLLIGLVFGAALQLGRVHEFLFIRDQFVLRHFVMLKMFLSASATSVLTIWALIAFGSKSVTEKYERARGYLTTQFLRGYVGVALGAFILGIGMTVAGSCPGTVFAQIGAGSKQAWLIFAGGIAGGLLTLVAETELPNRVFTRFLNWNPAALKLTKHSAEEFLGIPRWIVALGMAVFMYGCVLALELGFPWKSDLQPLLSKEEAEWGKSIAPVVAGAFIGTLQGPLIGILGNHLGSTTSYCALCANSVFFLPNAKELAGYRKFDTFWQLFMMVGVGLGALISSTATNVSFHSDPVVSNVEAVIGGALLVIGGRMAGGCTSGHGLSGVGYLSVISFVAVASMMAGAFATGFIFYY